MRSNRVFWVSQVVSVLTSALPVPHDAALPVHARLTTPSDGSSVPGNAFPGVSASEQSVSAEQVQKRTPKDYGYLPTAHLAAALMIRHHDNEVLARVHNTRHDVKGQTNTELLVEKGPQSIARSDRVAIEAYDPRSNINKGTSYDKDMPRKRDDLILDNLRTKESQGPSEFADASWKRGKPSKKAGGWKRDEPEHSSIETIGNASEPSTNTPASDHGPSAADVLEPEINVSRKNDLVSYTAGSMTSQKDPAVYRHGQGAERRSMEVDAVTEALKRNRSENIGAGTVSATTSQKDGDRLSERGRKVSGW